MANRWKFKKGHEYNVYTQINVYGGSVFEETTFDKHWFTWNDDDGGRNRGFDLDSEIVKVEDVTLRKHTKLGRALYGE